MATICKGCNEEVYRARWVESDGWYCLDCSQGPKLVANVPGNLFPYYSSNIGDHPYPMKVKSLRHLRKLEAIHGVQSVAWNYDQRNWGNPPRGKHGQAKEE